MPRKPNYKDLLKKFKKRNIKNPERIATAYVKGLTAGSKKKAAKNWSAVRKRVSVMFDELMTLEDDGEHDSFDDTGLLMTSFAEF